MSSRVTVVAREIERDKAFPDDAVRVAERDVWGVLRVAKLPMVVRETTLPVVLRVVVVFRSVIFGVRVVVVVRPRTFCVVWDVAELRRLVLSVLVCPRVPETDVMAGTRRLATRATSPTSSEYAAQQNPINATHPAKISPNFFSLLFKV